MHVVAPGDILYHEFMVPLDLTHYELATKVGLESKVIEQILHYEIQIDTKIANALGKSLNTTPEIWLNLQSQYNLKIIKQTNQS